MKWRTLIALAVAAGAGIWAGSSAAWVLAMRTVTRPLHAFERGRAIGYAEFRGGEGTFAGIKGRFALVDGRVLECEVAWGAVRCPKGVRIVSQPPKVHGDDGALGLI